MEASSAPAILRRGETGLFIVHVYFPVSICYRNGWAPALSSRAQLGQARQACLYVAHFSSGNAFQGADF